MDSELAKNALAIAVALVAAIIGVIKYVKTDGSKAKTSDPETGAVVSASFIDSKLLKELIETLKVHMETYAQESRKINRSRTELTAAMEDSTDAILSNTDALINVMRFIKRRDASQENEI
jgi:hypothetical protein